MQVMGCGPRGGLGSPPCYRGESVDKRNDFSTDPREP